MEVMYEVPGSDITHVTVTREVVDKKIPPIYKREPTTLSEEKEQKAAVTI